MNPNLATLRARNPRIFDPLPVILECEHMLIDTPKGPALDGRTAVTLTNDTTDTSVSVIVPNEDLPALVAAINTHLKEITQ
ncbi:hypothetical protein AB0O80_10495 [Rothia kristinae]|uniref:hypothetical protein n=1 Tax=Actinomycetes TaxID=1760 RepID=UPI0034441C78